MGRHAKLLASYYSVYGVDISSVEIELARKVTPQCHFEVGDMRTWRPSVHAEMLICMWSTFNYLSTDNDVKAFVDTTTANSSPGSLLVIDVKNPRRVIDETYERISYAYPYEIDITVTRKISSAGVRNGIYKYHIHNQLNGTSIVVTDQELNRIYEESRIREAFVPYFQLIATFGDYDLDVGDVRAPDPGVQTQFSTADRPNVSRSDRLNLSIPTRLGELGSQVVRIEAHRPALRLCSTQDERIGGSCPVKSGHRTCAFHLFAPLAHAARRSYS